MPNIEPTDERLAELNERYEDAHPADILKWAFRNVGNVAIAASLQVGGLVNIHMSRGLVDRVPVLFIETGFHFAETLAFKDQLVADWDLDLIQTKPTLGPERQAREIGPELYKTDPDLCCQLNRVIPLQTVLDGLDGWITGVRRDQSSTRATTPVFDRQRLNSGKVIWKISPLAGWSGAQVWWYAEEHGVPVHPLYEQGFLSIGCAPCTRKTKPGEDPRSGRWHGTDKAECGIHTFGGSAQQRAAG